MVDQPPRARLTAAAACVIAVALAVASIGAVLALQRSLLSAIDTTALDDAHDVAGLMTGGNAPDPIEPPTPDAAVQVLDRRSAVVAASRNAPPRPLLLPVAAAGDGTVTATGRLPLANSADAYHVAALRTRDGRLTVVVAIPSDDVADAVHQLTVVLAVGAPMLFVVLVVLAWLVIGRALAPMHALLRRQREFLSDAAHELRTPIAAVLARLELAEGDPHRDWRQELPRLRGEVTRMGTLVDGLLALARSGQQPSTVSEVDLDDLVQESVRRVRDRSALHVDSSGVTAVRLRGDGVALSHLVDNLLSNAVRHARTTVRVALRQSRQWCVLSVADDGPGIPAADRERVFERFTRLDASRSRTEGGVGLGLAIVRAVAESHGGRVSVHDNHPGARLEVRLPVSRLPG